MWLSSAVVNWIIRVPLGCGPFASAGQLRALVAPDISADVSKEARCGARRVARDNGLSTVVAIDAMSVVPDQSVAFGVEIAINPTATHNTPRSCAINHASTAERRKRNSRPSFR